MIGIVILNYRTWKETVECVDSIRKSTNCEYKIYLVDNNSPDDSYTQLHAKYHSSKDIVLMQAQYNNGYSAGNNLGIKRALSDGMEVILLSNSDVIYYSNSIDLMYTYLINNKHVGILGPKVVLPNNNIQSSPRMNYTFKNYILGKKPFLYFDFKGIMQETYFKNYKYDTELVFDGFVAGCCIALSKEYFEKCGLLDENVFLYFEESIISHKALMKGLKTCVLPQAVVLHKCSVSIGKQISAFSRLHRYYSSMYMLRRYKGINKIQLSFILFLNLIPFISNGIIKREYRKFGKVFIQKSLELFE
ncbi:glycosyltransferase family 2 protein [Paenibacillus sp.]|uniref:glycosyltransferase family 2 protein n=1 Tax=Paenibacillus sp. TaxID=58172 RepID=UPI002811FB69|nr:glycosyltransferase family 2 protein [Paenibacillus sp.]